MTGTKTILSESIIVPKDDNANLGGGSQVVRARAVLHVKDNSVTLTKSDMLMGKNVHSGKNWARWQTTFLVSLFRTSTGKYASIMRETSKNKQTVTGGLWAMSSFFSYQPARDAAIEHFGIEHIGDLYPALAFFEDEGNYGLQLHNLRNLMINSLQLDFLRRSGEEKTRRNFYRMLHNDDPREFISTITRQPYRKDIAKAVGRHGISQHLHKLGEIDPSWVAEVLNEYPEVVQSLGRFAPLYRANYVSTPVFRKFVTQKPDGEPYRAQMAYEDISRVVRNAIRDGVLEDNPARIRKMFKDAGSVRAVHDELVARQNRLYAQQARSLAKKAPEYDTPLKYSDTVKPIDGMTVGKYVLRLAKDGREIQSWGLAQNHCIGGYAHSAYSGDVLGAVYDGDTMVANFHLQKRTYVAFGGGPHIDENQPQRFVMRQIFGKHNQIFEDAGKIKDALVEKGLVVKGSATAGVREKELQAV